LGENLYVHGRSNPASEHHRRLLAG